MFSVDSKHLGLRIKQARERKGISQEDLAVAISKDQGAVSEYETGKRKLPAIDLPVLATILEVPLTYFFETELENPSLDEAMLNYFRRLPTPEDQQAAIDIVRIFFDRLRQHQD